MTEKDVKGRFTSSTPGLEGEYKEYQDRYGGWVTANVERDTTIERLKSGSKAWMAWCSENDIDPLEVSEDDVKLFILEMVEEGYSDTHITRSTASVSKFYHWLITSPRESGIDRNPTAGISLPQDFNIKNTSNYVRVVHKEGRPDIIAPPRDEVLKVCNHAPGKRGHSLERNELILKLMWQTALRSDEMSRIRTDNVDLEEREIRIRSAKLNKDDHPDLYIRRVWWEPDLDYLMHRHHSQQDAEYFFTDTNGDEPLEPPTISRLVKDAARDAGMQEPLSMDVNGKVAQHLWTGHRFRHARISYIANETDMGINHLRMMAGHAKVETTLDYVHSDWDAARSSYFQAVDPEEMNA